MKKEAINKMDQSSNIQSKKKSAASAILKISIAVAAFPAVAALPAIAPPAQGGIGGAQVQDGDIIGTMGGYFKMGLMMMGIVLAAYAFITIVIGALRRWKEYSDGRITVAELKEYIIAAVIQIAFIIVLVGYSASTLS